MFVPSMTLFDNSAYNTDKYQVCSGHMSAYTDTGLHIILHTVEYFSIYLFCPSLSMNLRNVCQNPSML